MSAGRYRRGQVLRILFGVAGLFFMGIVFRDTWNRSQGGVLPSWEYAIGAEALMVAGLAGASRGWVSLFDGQGSKRALARAFYAAQLGKYVPGAIWQAVGQVGLSRRAGVSLAQATVAFPVHALTWLAASGTVGAALAVLASSSTAAPVIAASLAQRLVTMVGELVMILFSRVRRLAPQSREGGSSSSG
jgi:hypothetical protein